MDLRTPIHLGGSHYLVAVSVGRDPDDDTVRDCPACGGYCYDDEFHLVATVRDLDAGGAGAPTGAEGYHFCSDGCLAGWLRTFPGT